MYKYETHLHTSPVSKCARATVRESLEFYKSQGYAGVFITNHFIYGNIGCDKTLPFKEKLDFYFSDYDEAKKLSKEIGIKVLLGVEITAIDGSDFLIYGLDKEWYYNHTELEEMKPSERLKLLYESGALVVQAHPFRDSSYIDHVHLFPRCTSAVEIYNANRTDLENKMAGSYAEIYGFAVTAGTDNHDAGRRSLFCGMEFDTPLDSEDDYVTGIKSGAGRIFKLEIPDCEA